MIAAPPVTAAQAHSAVRTVYALPAKAAGGRVVFEGCPRRRRSRVCHVRITGDAPQNLRVTIRRTPTNFIVAARDWS